MEPARSILHVDMDAFFAAIEQRDRPELRGKPLLVGGAGPRGVVATASYEARRFGCHSAQPMSVALRLCPQAVVVPGDGPRYHAVSEQLFELLEEFTPCVEPLSVDEAFLDVTGCERLFGSPVELARRLKARVRERLRLTASVGVAGNKFLAKLASDLEKPDGLTVLGPAEVESVLPGLPVERLWGVGRVTAERMHQLGIRTIGDLRAWSGARLEAAFGQAGEHFGRLARGLDAREVVPDHRARSLSQERTFPVDVEDPEHVRDVLRSQVEHVARRVRRHGFKARTVQVKLRYGAFETITRRETLPRASDVTAELLEAALRLYDRWARSGFRPVRLVGMGAAGLQEPADEQLDLFGTPGRARQVRLDQALDAIQDRFGGASIQRGAGGVPGRADGDLDERD